MDFVPRRKNPNPSDSWICPEHARLAQDMERDYPKDDWGLPLRGSKKELKIDSRPTILIEEKKRFVVKPRVDKPRKASFRPHIQAKRADSYFKDGRWSFDPYR